MADIQPIRALVYNPLKVPNLSAVVTPPYDVISPEEQEAFHSKHPFNIIRLILGRKYPNDSEDDNPHTRAAATFRRWISEGVLVREPTPTLYLTAHDFDHQGERITRWGVLAGVRLEPFEKGIILPHETTFSKVKTERLGLIQACNANLSPIFSIYSDPENGMMEGIRQAIVSSGRVPDIAFTNGEGQGHRVWKLTEPRLVERIASHLKQGPVLIADGHHRYETALQYRDLVLSRHPEFGASHPVHFVLMYLTAMEDSGLVVMPAHRIVHRVSPERLERMLDALGSCFDIEQMEGGGKGAVEEAARWLEDRMAPQAPGTRIGVIRRDRPQVSMLQLRPGVMERRYGKTVPAELLELDVTVLTHLVLMDVLGLEAKDLDEESTISYSKSMSQAVSAVYSGKADLSLILNPTRVDQVRKAAAAGHIMPRKSTYFYPKVLDGIAIHPLWTD
uniref:DUF1015 domain-containing protein n=1 Tax=Desulfatirhabdium butyrativorans TaxID=340467 RepID=A0A7C4MP70_9BACT